MDYRQWVRTQATIVENAMRQHARHANLDGVAAWFIPSSETEFARLEIAREKPELATDVILFSFPSGMTSKIGFVPYQHISGGIYDACRRMRVFPSGNMAALRQAVQDLRNPRL